MWKFSTALQRRWSGSCGRLWSAIQIPLQGGTCSSFAGSTVSRQPTAVCRPRELPQPQGTAPLRSPPLVMLPVSSDLPMQEDEAVLLPISGQLWRSFQPLIGLWDLDYNTVFPSIHSCCFPSFLQKLVSTSTLLNKHPAGYASSQSLHPREPRLRYPTPHSVCPPKPFFTEYLMSTKIGNILMLVSMSVRTKCLCGTWGRGVWAWNQVSIEMTLSGL